MKLTFQRIFLPTTSKLGANIARTRRRCAAFPLLPAPEGWPSQRICMPKLDSFVNIFAYTQQNVHPSSVSALCKLYIEPIRSTRVALWLESPRLASVAATLRLHFIDPDWAGGVAPRIERNCSTKTSCTKYCVLVFTGVEHVTVIMFLRFRSISLSTTHHKRVDFKRACSFGVE